MSAPSVYRLGLRAYARSPASVAIAERLDFEKLLRPAVEEVGVSGQQQRDAEPTKPPAYKPRKSFQLHIGAALSLPTNDARYVPVQQQEQQQQVEDRDAHAGVYDPFEGLPLRKFAESLGARFEPVAKVIRDEHRRKQIEAVKGVDATIAASDTEATLAAVPMFLPCTRWAAQNETVRDTLVADDPKSRKRARLSWYHPDDGMVPRDWFRGGLLEDLKYYSPFGLFKAKQQQQPAVQP